MLDEQKRNKYLEFNRKRKRYEKISVIHCVGDSKDRVPEWLMRDCYMVRLPELKDFK